MYPNKDNLNQEPSILKWYIQYTIKVQEKNDIPNSNQVHRKAFIFSYINTKLFCELIA